jgi:hypothetical protein
MELVTTVKWVVKVVDKKSEYEWQDENVDAYFMLKILSPRQERIGSVVVKRVDTTNLCIGCGG